MFLRDVLQASWRRDGDEAVFGIEADSFLRHMVRILVGTMLGVAGGRFELASFEELLPAPTAPPRARPRRRTRSAWWRCATDWPAAPTAR